jgi:hypothetical protein
MWEGWTPEEQLEIIKEVYIDRNGMVDFHQKVLKAQFWLWSLVPVLGCVSAPCRWKCMAESRRKYQEWAQSSHMALTSNAIIVVGLPSTRCPQQVQLIKSEDASEHQTDAQLIPLIPHAAILTHTLCSHGLANAFPSN